MFNPITGVYNVDSQISPERVQQILNDSLIALVKRYPGAMAEIPPSELNAVIGDRLDMRFNLSTQKLELFISKGVG